MGAFIVRRLAALVPLLFVITLVVFALVLFLPGDIARQIGGARATEAQVAALRAHLHLDDPILSQYWRWVSHAVRGDLGRPYYAGTQTVSEGIATRFPATLSLAVGGMLVSLLIGVPAGILAGTRPGSLRDRATTFGTSLGIAVPDFWLAMMLVVAFAVQIHLFPAIGYVGPTSSLSEWLKDLVLPCVALGAAGGATIARQLRGSLIDVLDQDYIRTAHAMGLRRRTVIGRYALNAATPVLTLVGLQFAYLLGGTFIIEQIFSINGMGQYILGAIDKKDLPIIQGVVLVIAVVFVVVNLIVDLSYGFLIPKARTS